MTLLVVSRLCRFPQFDIKNRRMFLAKYPSPSVSVKSLYLGGTITLHGRLLKITALTDDYTKQALGGSGQRCVCTHVL